MFLDVQLKKLVACDHELSVEYFTQSVISASIGSVSSESARYEAFSCTADQQAFIDGDCNNINYMGYQAYKPINRTSYYLHMATDPPYHGKFAYNLQVYILIQGRWK